MDLFVGNYMTNEKEGSVLTSPLEKNRDWKYLTVRFEFKLRQIRLTANFNLFFVDY